jgi:glycosyltransferase involved in cell wall biosynthesis
MVFDATRARKHAIVESCRRLGYEATYVEPPNSNSRYHVGGSPTLNRGALRIAPPAAPAGADDGTSVLSVPKKLGLGPLRVHVGRRVQERLQARWLRAFFAERRSSRRTLAVVASPRWEPLLRDVPFDRVVFDHTDPPHVLRGWLPEEEFLLRRDALIRRSVGVWAVSEGLARQVREAHPSAAVRLLPNGVDIGFFESHREEPVPELRDLPRPIAGFLGTIAPWVDTGRFLACAEAYPDWSFVLAGPVTTKADLTGLRALPNVHWLGPLTYDRVPAVMESFDVALMPFRPGEFSEVANPVTLYELLSLGKPIVCTAMPELDGIADALYMSDEGFVAALERAWGEDDEALRSRRREIGRAHGWDRLIEDAMRWTLEPIPTQLRHSPTGEVLRGEPVSEGL